MDEFDHRRQFVMVAATIAQRVRHQQQDHWAQALAPGADDVFANLVDQRHLRAEPAPDHGIDGVHVFGDGGEQDGGGHFGQGGFRRKANLTVGLRMACSTKTAEL